MATCAVSRNRSITKTLSITGSSYQAGKSPYISTLSAYHITLPVDANNHVTDYASASTIFRFFIGDKEQNVDASNVVITPTSGGNVTYTIANEVGGLGSVVTISNVSDAVVYQTSLSISYTYQGTKYEQVYTLTKSNDLSNFEHILLMSNADKIDLQSKNQKQLIKQIRIPAGYLKSAGDFLSLKYSFRGGSYYSGNSVVDVNIGSLNLQIADLYGDKELFCEVVVDYSNKFSYAITRWADMNNDLGGSFPLVVPIQELRMNGNNNFTQIDWSKDVVLELSTNYYDPLITPTELMKVWVESVEVVRNLNSY